VFQEAIQLRLPFQRLYDNCQLELNRIFDFWCTM